MRRFDAQDLISRLTARPNSPYLQQLPCSWGAVYFPRAWREFAQYMQFRVNQNNTTPLLIREVDYGLGEELEKYFVEYMYINSYFLLYPNFPNQASLSTNHLEEGEHIMRVTSHSHLNEDFTVPLLRNRSLMEILTNLPGPSQITPPAERRGHHHHYHLRAVHLRRPRTATPARYMEAGAKVAWWIEQVARPGPLRHALRLHLRREQPQCQAPPGVDAGGGTVLAPLGRDLPLHHLPLPRCFNRMPCHARMDPPSAGRNS